MYFYMPKSHAGRWIYSLLTSAKIEESSQLHTSDDLPPENYQSYALNMELAGCQYSFGRIVIEKILSAGGNRITG